MLNLPITIPYDQIAAFCERHHIRKLALFGSVLRDDFRSDGDDPSDVDVLVEFEEGDRISYLDLARIKRELGELLKYQIDIGTFNSLHPQIYSRVQPTLEIIYER
jgi:hypothetical protein